MKYMRLIIILPIAFLMLNFSPNIPGININPITKNKAIPEDKPHPLSKKHKRWLEEEVVYIISDQEKAIFLQLPSDEFRERFITNFWLARDPTPGTPKNEFKEEHYKRIEYANKFYGRDTTRPGWMTDRGKVHILLGEPRFKHDHSGDFNIYPTELWHYISVNKYGLPTSFYLIFFKDRGAGEFRLYSPTMHGIQRLFHVTSSIMGMDMEQLYDYAYREIDPELAHACFNLIPSEPGYAGVGPESNPLASEMVLAKIEDAKNYQAPIDYAERILANRPMVEVKYNFSPVSLRKIFYWSQASSGDFFIDYGFQIQPDDLGMGQYNDKFYSNLTIEGYIKNDKEEVIDTISHKVDIDLNEEKFDKIRKRPLNIFGRRVLIPGNYFISLIIKDNVAKRAFPLVGYVNIFNEKKITYPYFCPVLLGDTLEDVSGSSTQYVKPFQFSTVAVHPSLDSCFTPNEKLIVYTQIIFPVQAISLNPMHLIAKYVIKQNDEVIRQQTQSIAGLGIDTIEEGTLPLIQLIDLADLNLGNYTLIINLYDNNKLLSWSEEKAFEIVKQKNNPWIITKGTAPFTSPAHKYIMAQQYLRNHQIDLAIEALENTVERLPDFVAGVSLLAKIYYQQRQYDKVVVLLEPQLIKHPREYEFLWYMGHSLCALKRFDDAIKYLERARMEKADDLDVLNQLARIYYLQGKNSKALELVNKSLSLKPDQPKIISLKKKINTSSSF
jgi:GWxTD domain-containing protein